MRGLHVATDRLRRACGGALADDVPSTAVLFARTLSTHCGCQHGECREDKQREQPMGVREGVVGISP